MNDQPNLLLACDNFRPLDVNFVNLAIRHRGIRHRRNKDHSFSRGVMFHILAAISDKFVLLDSTHFKRKQSHKCSEWKSGFSSVVSVLFICNIAMLKSLEISGLVVCCRFVALCISYIQRDFHKI